MGRFKQSGPINFEEVPEFFGQNRNSIHRISDYYRGGGIVPATGPTNGQSAIHDIAVDMNASSDGGNAEEFFIKLDGRSSTTASEDIGGFFVFTLDRTGRFQWANSQGSLSSNPDNAVEIQIRMTRAQLDQIANIGEFTVEDRSLNAFILFSNTVIEYDADGTTFSHMIPRNGDADTGSRHTYERMSADDYLVTFDGLTAIGTVPDSPINVTTDLTLRTVDDSSVRFTAPSLSIDETFTLTRGLTTSTTLRDDLLTQLQANTNVANAFIVTSSTVDSNILQFVQNLPQESLLPNLVRNRVNLGLFYDTTGAVNSGAYAFVDTMSNVYDVARSSQIELPTSRPTNTRAVINFAYSSDTNSLNVIRPIVKDLFNFELTNQPIDLTDVSAFGRRLIMQNANFNASYAIDQAANLDDFARANYYFVLSDGRELNAEEQAIIDVIDATTTRDPMTIIQGTQDVNLGDPIISLTHNGVGDLAVSTEIDAGNGALGGSLSGSHIEGVSGTESSVRIDYGLGVSPQTVDIIFGEDDSDGIAQAITETVDGHAQLNASIRFNTNALLGDTLNEEAFALDYDTNVSLSGTSYSYTTGATTNADLARLQTIELPAERPVDAFIVAQYGIGTQTIWSDLLDIQFPNVYTTGTTLNLTDVSRFNRRLIVNTHGFNASYAIDRLAVHPNDARLQYFELSDGRDFNRGEHELIGNLYTNVPELRRQLDPDLMVIVEEGDPSVVIEDSRQRERSLPVVTVTTAGSSNLANSDFTVTQVQAGEPTSRTTENLTIEYSTDDVALNAAGWNFHNGVTGDRVQLTAWPTTGDLVLHIGGLEFSFNELETTLGVNALSETLQTVTDATLTFDYNFLGLAFATTTYDISGIRTVNTGTGVALAVVLDATTVVQSTANTDPGFADEQVVGLTFFRRPVGNINRGIPIEGLTFTPEYNSQTDNIPTGTAAFFSSFASSGQNIGLTEWPSVGDINFRMRNIITADEAESLFGFEFPLSTFFQFSNYMTNITISDGSGNEATYTVARIQEVVTKTEEVNFQLDATTLVLSSGTPAFTSGDTLTVTFVNPLSFNHFYNANDGSNT